MESIIETFHLDWKLFLAQLVNFAIVVFVLWRFAFKPLAKNLNERTKTIEKSLKHAKDIENQHKEILALKENAVFEAKIDAKKIIDEAAEKSKKLEEEMRLRMKNEAQKILEKTKSEIEEEKVKMLADARQETADLVVVAMEKVLKEKITPALDRQIAEKAIDSLIGKN